MTDVADRGVLPGADFTAAPREELENLLLAVLEDNADAILLLESDGTVLFANPEARRVLGSDDLAGQSFGFPLAGDEPAELDVLVAGKPRVFEMVLNRTRFLGREVHVATLRDVTARKRTEEALRGFVSTASHEFQTPLAAITGVAEVLLEEAEEGIEAVDMIEQLQLIARQAGRLRRLADDLLTLSRLDAGRREVRRQVVRLSDVLGQALRTAGVADDFEVDVPEGLLVLADPDHVQMLIGNYLSNALKYGETPYVVTAATDEDQIVVKVRDHGDGVPASFEPRLFERFSRYRNGGAAPGGTGLGLAIVSELAQLNGGDAWYEGSEGEGAVFCFSLPVA